jgi:hypothetical protein
LSLTEVATTELPIDWQIHTLDWVSEEAWVVGLEYPRRFVRQFGQTRDTVRMANRKPIGVMLENTGDLSLVDAQRSEVVRVGWNGVVESSTTGIRGNLLDAAWCETTWAIVVQTDSAHQMVRVAPGKAPRLFAIPGYPAGGVAQVNCGEDRAIVSVRDAPGLLWVFSDKDDSVLHVDMTAAVPDGFVGLNVVPSAGLLLLSMVNPLTQERVLMVMDPRSQERILRQLDGALAFVKHLSPQQVIAVRVTDRLEVVTYEVKRSTD